MIRVRVLGCVARPGTFELRAPATLRSAIRAAGGWGNGGLLPEGAITVRAPRERDGRSYVRRRLHFVRHPDHLRVHLRHLDLVVVQYEIRGRSTARRGKQ